MTIEQISVFVENKAGRLAEITELLGNAGIDMRAMSIADTTDFGILRLIADDSQKALSILRDAGCIVTVTPVLAVPISDTPGSLASILRLVSDAGISVEYLYAFITRRAKDAYVILRVEDNSAAEALFEKNGITLASHDDLYKL